MKVELTRTLRVEITPVRGRMVCRVFHGDEEKPASPALLNAIASVIAGQRAQQVTEVLTATGILVPEQAPADAPVGPIRLAPTVAVNLRLRPVPGMIDGPAGPHRVRVLPENSLPIGLFVPPAILASAQQVDRAVKTAWMTLLRGAQSRGEPLDKQAAHAVLVGVVDEHLERDAVLARVLAWKGARKTALKSEVPLQVDNVFYPVDSVELVGDRLARQPDAPTIVCAVGQSPGTLVGLGLLLGRLCRGDNAEDIDALVRDLGDPAVRQVWRDLARHGWLDTFDDSERIALDPGQVMHLGHATLLARLGDAHVLVDPWILPASASDATPPIPWSALPPLDAVFVTHHHWDHVNLETLLKLDKAVPIYVPRQNLLARLSPKTAELLATLGFASVRTLPHGEGVDFDGGGRVEAAPFYGEDPTGIQYGANTYVLVHDGHAALVHVDSGTNSLGESMVSTGTAEQIVASHGALNPVFATRRQERGTMVEHTWEYLLQPTRAWVEPTENCCNDAAFLGSLAAACASEHLVLYSEGGADYYPFGTDFLRGTTPRPGDAAHEYGWDSLDAIRAAVEGAGARLHGSAPGHVFTIGGGVVS